MSSCFDIAERIAGFLCNAVGVIGGVLGVVAWWKLRNNRRVSVRAEFHGIYKGKFLQLAIVVKNESGRAVVCKDAGIHLTRSVGSFKRSFSRGEQTIEDGAEPRFWAAFEADEDIVASLERIRPFAVVGRKRRVYGPPVDLEHIRSAWKNRDRQQSPAEALERLSYL